uniref:Putative two-component response regulator n=1 Tax=Magnetococcus massalia (strain MO-1) TaxID=451514 RepID=A0A1S7LJR8_MAGMO
MKRILIMEDEPALAVVMQRALAAENYHVEISENGKEGLELIRVFKPDLLILDIIMPEMDGVEVLSYLHRNNMHIPTLAISGGGNMVTMKDCLNISQVMGAVDCLQKPFSQNDLILKVSALLEATPDRS